MTTVKLPFKKETKNMLQYQAVEKKASPIPTLYVSKDIFDGEWPPFLKVTVEGAEK